jgi:hypothetical protein
MQTTPKDSDSRQKSAHPAPLRKLLPIAVLAGCVLAGCGVFGSDEAVPFSDFEQADALYVPVARTAVIKDQPSWVAFWQQHGGEAQVPPVDFERQTVFGVFYGQQGGCTSKVDVVRSIHHGRSALEVAVGPLPDLGLCRAIVYPLDVVVADVPPSQVHKVTFVGKMPGTMARSENR